MSFICIIHPSVFAFLVTLFSIIPCYLTHEGGDYFFKDEVNVLENCPTNSRCVAIERCPHLYRTLSENPDGSPLYISCNTAKSIMAVPELGICCNHDFLDENVAYTEKFPIPDLDLDTMDEHMVGGQSFNTEDFTRTTRGASDQSTQNHPQTYSIPSHTSTPETLHHTPTHHSSYDVHHKSEEEGGGISDGYYNGLKPDELAYILEGFGDAPEYYASAVDRNSHYDPIPFHPSKAEEYTERDIPETVNPGPQPNYFPYFMPHVAAFNIRSQFQARGYPGGLNNKERTKDYNEKPHSSAEMDEGLTTTVRSELLFKREEPDSNHPDYEDDYCPLSCRGRPGLPGPIGPRGFPGPPGPPGPPGRVIFVNAPVPASAATEDSSSKHSSSLSEISSYGSDYNADDPVQIQPYEASDVSSSNQHSNSDIPTLKDNYDSFHNRRYNRHYGHIPYKPMPPREPQNRAHVSKRQRRSAETPKTSQENGINYSQLKRLISQLIKEHFNNNN